MTAQLLQFPNIFRPASPRNEPCLILVLPILHTPRECPKITELRRQSKMLREHFKANPKFSGGTCSGGEG